MVETIKEWIVIAVVVGVMLVLVSIAAAVFLPLAIAGGAIILIVSIAEWLMGDNE